MTNYIRFLGMAITDSSYTLNCYGLKEAIGMDLDITCPYTESGVIGHLLGGMRLCL